ncbi:MAG: 2,3-dihydroxyphenylpropionate 1,2-dioxygenase [Betaproteobacteria bacterium]|nr:2,3-dihydroxyphenylpropionate 1,2-dioxygenase [Betaproteobacteria bacterium]
MAELVGVFAASHAPLIVRGWEGLTPESRQRVTDAFAGLGKRIKAARPDVLIVVSPDHWVNFFLDNLPSICVGVGETHAGPPEPWLGAFPHRQVAGHAPLAQHLVEHAHTHGFEPSLAYQLKLDHGFCIPLWKAALDPLPAIVPVVINTVEPPFPAPQRCLDFGACIAGAVRSFPGALRVGVLGSGGLSHSIGEATMGAIDEAFDREFVRLLASGTRAAMLEFLEQRLEAAGNGTAEIRNWLTAHGAAGERGFELIHYSAMPEIYVGHGFAAWRV